MYSIFSSFFERYNKFVDDPIPCTRGQKIVTYLCLIIILITLCTSFYALRIYS